MENSPEIKGHAENPIVITDDKMSGVESDEQDLQRPTTFNTNYPRTKNTTIGVDQC
jgi:hypothetical protein